MLIFFEQTIKYLNAPKKNNTVQKCKIVYQSCILFCFRDCGLDFGLFMLELLRFLRFINHFHINIIVYGIKHIVFISYL